MTSRPSFRGRCAIAKAVLRLLCCALVMATAAVAQKPKTPFAVTLDPATTAIHWTLNTTFHTVHGTFKLKSGSFRIDPSTGEASGLIILDATSGESGDAARDRRMHTVILESPQYPTISFRPTHVDGSFDLNVASIVMVHGVVTLHGQDHPLQITVELHPQSSAVAISTRFAVPFVAWGLKDPSTFVFRTDKEVILDIAATIATTPEPGLSLPR